VHTQLGNSIVVESRNRANTEVGFAPNLHK